MADRELPVMTDEQIDAVWMRALAGTQDDQPDRGCLSWAGLREAFPAPRPPRPQGAWFSVTGNYIAVHDDEILTAHAAAALVELQACVDWITEEDTDA